MTHLATATLEKLLDLAKQGATVIIQDGWPTEVPGFHHDPSNAAPPCTPSTAGAPSAVVQCSGSILPALAARGVLQERMTDAGLRFVRRRHAEGYHYFIVNRSGKRIRGRCAPGGALSKRGPPRPVACPGGRQPSLALRPPCGWIPASRSSSGPSLANPSMANRGRDRPLGTRTIPLRWPWKLEFTDGGPVLPQAAELRELGSWTEPAGSRRPELFRHREVCDRVRHPARTARRVRLDLGKVCHTARVYLNGSLVGISWCPPGVIDPPRLCSPAANELVIEVTNLAANRIADLDRRKVPWKRFHEINFVNIDYGHRHMFEQTFKTSTDVLSEARRRTSESDYTEQSSWSSS